MTLHPINEWRIPKETEDVARASFPKGNVYMKMYDSLGILYSDEDFRDLFPVKCGKSAISPARLALVTIMQFMEGLTDRQAANAVRSRIDWKYLLGLNLTDCGFDSSVLTQFRQRLCEHQLANQLLDKMLAKFDEHNLINKRGKQRTDSTRVVAGIRLCNRLELVGETLRAALNEIASLAPQWLKRIISDDWFDRYSYRIDDYRLPKKKTERYEMALLIGSDGHYLLHKIWFGSDTPAILKQLKSVEVLRNVWIQQYTFIQDELTWRNSDKIGLPPNSICIESPYDIDARNGTKRNTNWTGYNVHLTETCDEDTPNLITNVETTTAIVPDGNMTLAIHDKLADKGLLPKEHYVDAAYVDSYKLTESYQKHQINIVGSVAVDYSWQARSNMGFDVASFIIDWDKKQAICPQGHFSKSWCSTIDCRKSPIIQIKFDRKICADCPVRNNCTKSKKSPRIIKIRPQAEYDFLTTRRIEQQTPEFEEKYKLRSGIEGTISQGVRQFDLRRTRYFGIAKTHLQHVATACAINLSRFFNWSNHQPKSRTRITSFASLRI